jgi:hypothetical protein
MSDYEDDFEGDFQPNGSPVKQYQSVGLKYSVDN